MRYALWHDPSPDHPPCYSGSFGLAPLAGGLALELHLERPGCAGLIVGTWRDERGRPWGRA
ncbi:MAG TPA: hypothetical protein VFS43_13265 [Polyangiaceae bacterium]|nr:hypothetical protein [Polyangiaceae bacterium]